MNTVNKDNKIINELYFTIIKMERYKNLIKYFEKRKDELQIVNVKNELDSFTYIYVNEHYPNLNDSLEQTRFFMNLKRDFKRELLTNMGKRRVVSDGEEHWVNNFDLIKMNESLMENLSVQTYYEVIGNNNFNKRIDTVIGMLSADDLEMILIYLENNDTERLSRGVKKKTSVEIGRELGMRADTVRQKKKRLIDKIRKGFKELETS
ncbi:hypothetical protein JZO72_11065 [Vagococcus fluvialis]|uniref:hypothetical protein n=1 Tax=Vagococcus fluvialis TaxID=2738 RepID=UPI001A908B4A|nr:hypothetical protein [Vagococcus fluvialis]MBO0480172.1 hypothetical protein [Vagococcus fluvialis]MBO0483937.1 hypothetical protein [Vagococcus fluvialis]